MRIALYGRVSTTRQVQAQTIDDQLARLRAHVEAEGSPVDEWTSGRVDEWMSGRVDEWNVFRDAGYSGATLNRPGLDHLRDRAALAEFDLVVVTAHDRLARTYGHHVLLIEEREQRGCHVEFLERPMSQDEFVAQRIAQRSPEEVAAGRGQRQHRCLRAYLAVRETTEFERCDGKQG